MNRVLSLYRNASGFPAGKFAFSRILTHRAPYFRSIRPFVSNLDKGCCTVFMKDRRAIHNHLGTIHAIAMCNLCELTMGLAVESAMPDELRWIAKGMEVEYIKKALGRLSGQATIDPNLLSPGDVRIPVYVRDDQGDEVARAHVTIYISRRPAKAVAR